MLVVKICVGVGGEGGGYSQRSRSPRETRVAIISRPLPLARACCATNRLRRAALVVVAALSGPQPWSE